jgi:uncharacterized membrane protein YdbT with pleckstrin-like domain
MPKTPRLSGTNRYLAPGEKVLWTTRRHPVLLLKPILVWMATLLMVGLISFVLTEGNPIPFVDQVNVWISLALTAYLVYKAMVWWKSYYVITDERVLLLTGFISVNVSAVRLARVAETSFSRSVFGRIFGYGDLKLDAAGEQLSLATLTYLPRAEQVYRLVTSLLLDEYEPEPEPYDPGEETTGPLPPLVL